MLSAFGLALFLLGGLIGVLVFLVQKFAQHNPETANELKQLIGKKLIAKAAPVATTVAKSADSAPTPATPDDTKPA